MTGDRAPTDAAASDGPPTGALAPIDGASGAADLYAQATFRQAALIMSYGSKAAFWKAATGCGAQISANARSNPAPVADYSAAKPGHPPRERSVPPTD